MTHVFLLVTHSHNASVTLVFKTLVAAYKHIQTYVPIEVHTVAYDIVANEIMERSHIEQAPPFLVAWSADKSWKATINRHKVLEG